MIKYKFKQMHRKCILIKYKQRVLVVNAHRLINWSVTVIIVDVQC